MNFQTDHIAKFRNVSTKFSIHQTGEVSSNFLIFAIFLRVFRQNYLNYLIQFCEFYVNLNETKKFLANRLPNLPGCVILSPVIQSPEKTEQYEVKEAMESQYGAIAFFSHFSPHSVIIERVDKYYEHS